MAEAKPTTRPTRRKFVAAQDKLMLCVTIAVVGSFAARAYLAYRETLLRPDHSAAATLGGYGLALLAVLLPGVYLIIGRIFSPVRRLAAAARNVSEGKFRTVDIARGDALGALAASFNDMVLKLAAEQTAKQAADAELRKANANLERTVAARTAEAEAALKQVSSEIAEKEDFLRAVSHDLNAPLRNIDGMCNMIVRKHGEALPEDVLRRLDRVQKNVAVETDLINDLLELSRIKTRREEPEPTNLQQMAWDLTGMFEADLRQKHIDLVVETKLPTVNVERGRMRQVFQNLIDNAIKFMPDDRTLGENRIAVGCRVADHEAEFWVSDTGRGIPADEIDKVFYVFRRGTNHPGVAGKGLGLASVKSIVETYQGTIWVESEEGAGCTFRFTINGRYLCRGGLFNAKPDADATDAVDAIDASAEPDDEGLVVAA